MKKNNLVLISLQLVAVVSLYLGFTMPAYAKWAPKSEWKPPFENNWEKQHKNDSVCGSVGCPSNVTAQSGINAVVNTYCTNGVGDQCTGTGTTGWENGASIYGEGIVNVSGFYIVPRTTTEFNVYLQQSITTTTYSYTPLGSVPNNNTSNDNGDGGERAYVPPPPPPSCDANAWGPWSACSVTCGGGTSTRTNACGTIQSQGCNAVPCAGPWWQVKDGSVHSASDVFSNIPGVCAGGCTPSLLTGVSGLASYLGTLGVGGGTLSQDGTDWQAKTVYTGTRTGFGYFKRLLEDDPAGIGAWDGGLPAQNGVSLAEGSMATDGAWNIGSTEKFVFLADGDVTVTGNIDVVPGGFLAVIASGNINIAPAVTKIEGVFVSDGVIDTGISNRQLTGEGIFTGWEGINLQRNLDDDSQTPAELFVYRPDLQLNAYRYLLWLGINWREVAP